MLIEAFCREFCQKDDVSLYIKTFVNPHNRIYELLDDADSDFPGHAPVRIVTDSLTNRQIRFLYEHSGLFG